MSRSVLGLAGAAALAGCTGQSTPSSTADPASGAPVTSVGPSVAPRAPRLPYKGAGKELADVDVHALPGTAIAIDVDRDRTTARTRLRRADGTGLVMSMSDDGKLDTGGAFPGPLADLVESLPAPNTQLQVGKAYEAGAPDRGYLDKAFAEGSVVIWQVTHNTPLAIYTEGDRKLVALDVIGYNRGYARDGGGIHESAMGAAFHARTDLAFTPETGWVVLRLRRVVQSEAKGDPETLGFADLVAARHSEFNACLDLPIKLDGLAAATDADFPACH
jgi:hypothetical protein